MALIWNTTRDVTGVLMRLDLERDFSADVISPTDCYKIVENFFAERDEDRSVPKGPQTFGRMR